MGRAWLLSKSGQEIPVLNHPSETFEFESVVEVVLDYGSVSEQKIASQYLESSTPELKSRLLSIYNNNWCKIRTWGTFQEEVTFRITSTGYNWYDTIVDFLLRHPEFKNSEKLLKPISRQVSKRHTGKGLDINLLWILQMNQSLLLNS